MEIFEVTKTFPKEEKYSLTDQVRRSSRSVSICLIEAYRKKRYVAHFVAKATDADGENSETSGWLNFSLACKYIDQATYRKLTSKSEEVGRLLYHMINNPDQYWFEFEPVAILSGSATWIAYCLWPIAYFWTKWFWTNKNEGVSVLWVAIANCLFLGVI